MALALKQQYNLIEFMQVYSPACEVKLVGLQVTAGELALNDKLPSIGLVNDAYGTEAATEWINNLLYDFTDYCEQPVGTEASSLEEFSSMVLAKYYYLNVAELLLFFAKVKAGEFGKIYGVVGAMRLMEMLNAYVQVRNADMDNIERRRATEALMRTDPNAVTYEEYQRLKAEGKL